HPAARCKKPCPRTVPRLSQRERRRAKLTSRNLRGFAARSELVALARRAFLHPGREISAGDLYGDHGAFAPAADRLSGLPFREKLLSVPCQSRSNQCVWSHSDGRG